ncbi:MAG: hypothetical protein ACYTF7_08885 [Planctomycetota bacterium]
MDASYTDAEQVRFDWLATRIFGLYESLYADKTSGLIDEHLAGAYERYYNSILSKPGFRGYWKSHQDWFFKEFVTRVNQVFAATDASARSADSSGQRTL